MTPRLGIPAGGRPVLASSRSANGTPGYTLPYPERGGGHLVPKFFAEIPKIWRYRGGTVIRGVQSREKMRRGRD